MDYDYAFKFIIVGDSAVGKTSILSRFLQKSFDPNHEFTIGVEFGAKTIKINQKNIKLQIWDTAGQQQFLSITRSYYRSSAAALVVFDITRRKSFQNILKWVRQIRDNGTKDIQIVLVANKLDLLAERVVSRNQAVKLATDNDMKYIQASAKSQQNIDQIFLRPTIRILDKIECGHIDVRKEEYGIKINIQKKPIQPEQCKC